MYDNLSEEIDAIQNSILATWDASENLKIYRAGVIMIILITQLNLYIFILILKALQILLVL